MLPRPLHLCRALLLIAVALSCRWTFAETCPHMESERSNLYQRSAFAHGYIHGYEQGFHVGNQDLQLARAPRDITKLDEYREAAKDYRSQFGARDAFRAGYRDGMLVGYTDARSGHKFRAIYEARIAAARLQPETAAEGKASSDRNFELGFMDGYRAGAHQGVGDGRNRNDYRPAQAECTREGTSLAETYCAGYLRGFPFGYSDGYINHDQLAVGGKGSRQTILTAARD